MKQSGKKSVLVALLVLATFGWGCERTTQGAQVKAPQTDGEKLSYAIGFIQSEQIKRLIDTMDYDQFAQAMRDVYEGKEPALTPDEMQGAIRNAMMAKQAAEMQAQQNSPAASENLVAAEAFLAQNGSKEGVQTTESGLQYKIIAMGEGASPTPSSTVKVHYRGTLIDGTEFDSSYSRGQPAEFGVSQVIPGWTEGLQLMSPGAKFEFYIHPKLGYGPRGAGAAIGPNSALIFEVELLEVK